MSFKSNACESSLSLEERIRGDTHANAALNKLLANPGIDASELLRHLHSVDPSQLLSVHRWEDKSNVDRRAARSLVSRLMKDAQEVGNFLTDDYRWFLTVQNRKCMWIRFVPKFMKAAAHFIEALLDATDDRGVNPDEHWAREQLTKYVETATGRPHDQEVADLLSFILERPGLTAEEQRKYRTRTRKTGHK